MNTTDTQLVTVSHTAQRDDQGVEPTATLTGAGAAAAPARDSNGGKVRARGKARRAAVTMKSAKKAPGTRPAAPAAGSPAPPANPATARRRSKPGGPAQQGNVSANDRAPRPDSKLGRVVMLLRRKCGASIVDLGTATGWQPHTVRAALTGLRKRGIAVTRDQDRHGKTVYRIARG